MFPAANMKWWKSLLGAGLVSISMATHAPNAPYKTSERIAPLTERIDNSFSRYSPHFQTEKKFWKTAFLTDPSKTLVFNRDNVEIIDTVKTPVTSTPEEEEKASSTGGARNRR